MEIQQVIAMSNETSAQSGKAGASPAEAEYNAVYAAVTATERGRWFLAEFANRNGKADTDLILAAIERVEAAIRAGAVPRTAMQERGQAVQPPEVAAAEVPGESVSSEPFRSGPGRAIASERDEEVVDTPDVATAQHKFAPDVSPQKPLQPGVVSAAKVLTDEDYSGAVAAIAASLASRLQKSANESAERENLVEGATANEARPVSETVPAATQSARPAAEARPREGLAQGRVPQDNSPRWHIEGPDFVFGAAGSDEAMPGSEPRRETAQMQAQRLGAEIMSTCDALPEQIGVRSAAGEEQQPLAATARFFEAPPAPVVAQESTQERTSEPFSSSALDAVPLGEIARPQMRITREAMPPQRPPRYGSLTVTDALSEDEVIALFG